MVLWQTRQLSLVTRFFTNKCWTVLKPGSAFQHNESQGRNQVLFSSNSISYCDWMFVCCITGYNVQCRQLPYLPYKTWKYMLCPENLGACWPCTVAFQLSGTLSAKCHSLAALALKKCVQRILARCTLLLVEILLLFLLASLLKTLFEN